MSNTKERRESRKTGKDIREQHYRLLDKALLLPEPRREKYVRCLQASARNIRAQHFARKILNELHKTENLQQAFKDSPLFIDREDLLHVILHIIKDVTAKQQEIAAKTLFEYKKKLASEAADVRHAKSRENKIKSFLWLDENRSNYSSDDQAAAAMMPLYSIAHSTARNWIDEWRKDRNLVGIRIDKKKK